MIIKQLSILESHGTVKFVDEKIDDGVTDADNDDEYVMMRSYDLTTNTGEQFYVRLYYGNNTRLFTCYDYDRL